MLHSGGDPVEVFLVQHAVQSGDNPASQQPAADASGMAEHHQQQPFVQEAPSLGMQAQQPQQQQMQQAAAATAAGQDSTDISMEPPGNLAGAAAAAAVAAAAAAAAGGSAAEPAAAAARQPPSASPISLLAKAIGAGGVSANDIPVLPPAGAAAMVKQETAGSSHPAPAGLNSPVFPPQGGLSSPGIGACASPAQAGAKWNEIDPEAWFDGDGSALGALGDFFKNDTSIFQPSTTDQNDSDLVTAW